MARRRRPSREVAALLAALPRDRRDELRRVRDAVLGRLPVGYEEVVSGDVIVYRVPLDRYTHGRAKQPLWFAALASGKTHLSLHLMSIYADPGAYARLAAALAAQAHRPTLGKACIRFTRADQLPLDLIGDIVAAMPPDRWIEVARSARERR
jgi:hypothetical protein